MTAILQLISPVEIYDKFRDLARNRVPAFAKAPPARRMLRDRQAINHTTTVGSATSPAKISFFNNTSPSQNPAVRTQDPQLVYGAASPQETLICMLGVGLKFDFAKLSATMSFADRAEYLSALGESMLEIYFGTDLVLQESADSLLFGAPGNTLSNDVGGTPKFVPGPIVSATPPFLFERPRVLNPGASFRADLYIPKTAWTTTVDANIDIYIPALVASLGDVPQAPATVAL